MAVSERLGGEPSLTAARGFAVGLAAHGIGTARAFTVDTVAGPFAGIAVGLDAIVTAILAPLLLGLF